MTVGELIDILKDFNYEDEIVMGSANSMYVDSISTARDAKLRSFWGDDRDVVLLISDGQVGAV